jgi:hypothetical protein
MGYAQVPHIYSHRRRLLGVVDGSSLKSLSLMHSPIHPYLHLTLPTHIDNPQSTYASSFRTSRAIGCGHDWP